MYVDVMHKDLKIQTLIFLFYKGKGYKDFVHRSRLIAYELMTQ